jgi:hypothetical protein
MTLNSIPIGIKNYINLAEYFNMLGSHVYGDNWTGEEIFISEIITYEDAARLITEENEKSSIVMTRYGCASDEKLKEIDFHTDEVDGLDVYESSPKEYELRMLVSNLRDIRSTLAGLPSVKDKENYEAIFECYKRKSDILEKIIELFAQGLLLCFTRSAKGRVKVSNDFLTSLPLRIDLIQSEIQSSENGLLYIEIAKDDVEESLKIFPSAGTKIYQNKNDVRIAVENELMLIHLNFTADNIPVKKEIFKYFEQRFHPNLSKRAFDSIWGRVAIKTGSKLDKGGRRKKSN